MSTNAHQRLNHALDLMRRLPPQAVEKHLGELMDLAPDLTENLLCCVDQPLRVARDTSCAKDFLLCDYNRDADSHRSPWSNRYFPTLDDGAVPSDRLRQVEIELNFAMQRYRDLYYGGDSIASAYLWDLDTTAKGFAGAVLIKKCSESGGQWDSVHVIKVAPKASGRAAKYKLTATVMLRLLDDCSNGPQGAGASSGAGGDFDLGGSLTRQTERECGIGVTGASEASVAGVHVANIGRLIEETETSMRQQLIDVYFDNVCGVVESMRISLSKATRQAREQLQRELTEALSGKVSTLMTSSLSTDAKVLID